MYLHLIIVPRTPSRFVFSGTDGKTYLFWEREDKTKIPPGKGAAGLCWVVLRLVGIYWISSVTKCEMNHIVNHPQGRAREEELSIKADLQSFHSHRLLDSVSPADCSLTFNALGPQGWRGKSHSLIIPFFLSCCLSVSVCPQSLRFGRGSSVCLK